MHRFRRNADERLRQLERAAAAGDRDAQDALLVRRFRAGEEVSVTVLDDDESPHYERWVLTFRHPTPDDYSMEPHVAFSPVGPRTPRAQGPFEYDVSTFSEYGKPGQGVCFYSEYQDHLSAGGSVVDEVRRLGEILMEFGSPLDSRHMESLDNFRIDAPGWEYSKGRVWGICLHSGRADWERSGPAHACPEWRQLGQLVFVRSSLRRTASYPGRPPGERHYYYPESPRTRRNMRALSIEEFDRLAAEGRVERVRGPEH